MSAIEPEQYGPYSLLRSLGKGGMAEVFLARAEGPGGYARLLAIKRLLTPYAATDQLVSMMADEARLSVWLAHPNIVQVLDFGRVGKTSYYIAMEYVDGCDLCQLVRIKGRRQGRPLPLATALYVIHHIADALDYAHRRVSDEGVPLNIIHRDVSPHNVLISREGQVKLADFGLARASISVHESHAGVIRGKFAYMPKEQANGREIDHRIDIFAAGATLYEALTGIRPYSASNLAEQLYQLEQPVPVPSTHVPDIPPEIDDLTMQALAPDPETRYQTAEELANDLRHALAKLSTPSQEAQQLAALVKSAVGPRLVNEEALRPALGDLPQDCSLIGDAIAAAKRARQLHVEGLDASERSDEPEERDTLRSRPEPSPNEPTPASEISASEGHEPASYDGDAESEGAPEPVSQSPSELSVPTIARRLAVKRTGRDAAGDFAHPNRVAVEGLAAEWASPAPGDNQLRDVHGSISHDTRLPAIATPQRRGSARAERRAATGRGRPRPAPTHSEHGTDRDDGLDDAETLQRTPEQARSSIRRALERRGQRTRVPTDQVQPRSADRGWRRGFELFACGLSFFLFGIAIGWLVRGSSLDERPSKIAPSIDATAPTPRVTSLKAMPAPDLGADDVRLAPDANPPPPVVIVDARVTHAATSQSRADRAVTPPRARPVPRAPRQAAGVRPSPRPRTDSAPSAASSAADEAAADEGWITVTAAESALVFVDDRLVGPTPLQRSLLTPGIYQVKVLFVSDRSYSPVRFVTVRRGRGEALRFQR